MSSSAILDREPQLQALRQSVISRRGRPLTEFHRSRWVTTWTLQFHQGHIELTREGDGPWFIGKDTTPSAGLAERGDEVPPSVPPSTDTAAPTGNQSLASALEAVNGSTAEETLRRRVASLARHRGGVMTTIQRFTFGNGSVVSFMRQPGQAGWMQVEA